MIIFYIYDRFSGEHDEIYGYTFEDALRMAHLDNTDNQYEIVHCEYTND
jgi:hypothetical protein